MKGIKFDFTSIFILIKKSNLKYVCKVNHVLGDPQDDIRTILMIVTGKNESFYRHKSVFMFGGTRTV